MKTDFGQDKEAMISLASSWIFLKNCLFSLDFRLFRGIVLLRTVKAATSTYGDTYYDKRGKTDGAQVTLPGAAGDHDTDTDCPRDPPEQESGVRKAERKETAWVHCPRQVPDRQSGPDRIYYRARRRGTTGQIQDGQQ